jgi:hypothetical protein
MNTRHLSVIVLLAIVGLGSLALGGIAQAAGLPRFEVDSKWPKPLPNQWILGDIGGIH